MIKSELPMFPSSPQHLNTLSASTAEPEHLTPAQSVWDKMTFKIRGQKREAQERESVHFLIKLIIDENTFTGLGGLLTLLLKVLRLVSSREPNYASRDEAWIHFLP